MQTREKGLQSEAKILAALVEAGYLVSIPFGEGHKYDFIADKDSQLWRVQCKTGHIKNGALIFNAYSQSGNGRTLADYKGLADLFAIYEPISGGVYLMPVDEAGSTKISLRLTPTQNNQAERVRWAESYLLKPRPLKSRESLAAWAA